MSEESTKYQCIECGRIMNDFELISFKNPSGKEILKCRFCRGKVHQVGKNLDQNQKKENQKD
jgi:DNA-directed RNA polymerase subunit RPC12/RpoP